MTYPDTALGDNQSSKEKDRFSYVTEGSVMWLLIRVLLSDILYHTLTPGMTRLPGCYTETSCELIFSINHILFSSGLPESRMHAPLEANQPVWPALMLFRELCMIIGCDCQDTSREVSGQCIIISMVVTDLRWARQSLTYHAISRLPFS